MPIRYSSVVGGSSSSGFNLDIGSTGNNTFVFSEAQPAGGYSITSQLTDASIDFYAVAEDGSLAGYTNSKALTASQDFNKIVVYGATNNDLISFEFKPTTLPTESGTELSAAPYITSISDADLANIEDTTIITGGSFATNVTVTFTGTDNIVLNAKSVVRTDSTQLIVTRPDSFLEDNSPYTITVSNPTIPDSSYGTQTTPVTAGGDPVWTTASGPLSAGADSVSYSATVEATDPDGSAISYSIVSGALPTGLSLNSSTGEISGTPSTTLVAGETVSFTLSASDTSGNTTNRSFSIYIEAPPTPISATGGTIDTYTFNGRQYRSHSFTSVGTSTFTVSSLGNIDNNEIDYLVVAGGGGGGKSESGSASGDGGGGGGAGGVIVQSGVAIAASSYTVEVGNGGAGMSNGQNSSFSGSVAYGGGRGGTDEGSNNTASDNLGIGGGSGGGAASVCNSPGASGGSGTPGQGNSGGSTNGCNDRHGAGGGGAGAVGGNGNDLGDGSGGTGIANSYANGVDTYYGGGGGGGAGGNISNRGAAGNGGGGNGGTIRNAGSNGTANTGGGGGGAGAGTAANGGAGGSGIVVIRYPLEAA
jgi:hypothetical protein